MGRDLRRDVYDDVIEYVMERKQSMLARHALGGRSGQREQELGKRDRDESQQKCYICGKYGHISYNCPENDKSTKSMQGGNGKGRKSNVEFDEQE